MSLPARIHGVPLELVAFDGKLFSLVCQSAFAPGKPMPLTLDLDPPCGLDLKSIGSRVRPDGRYDVRARFTTLAKSTRERLVAALAAQASGAP